MSKHTLFLKDSDTYFNLSGSSTANCKIESCFFDVSNSKNFSEGAKKNMKKTQLDSNSPGPSSTKDCHPALIANSETLKPGMKLANMSGDKPVVTKTRKEKNFNCTPPASPEVSDFDSDKMEVDFFSKFNQKLPYSKQEDELILQYVLKGQNIFKVGSISLWKCLESRKENPKRTYQSLKNRFLRNIKPYLFTTYRHFIKNKETVDNILVKFPELKKQMGIRDTLSKINLPTRKCPPKILETIAPANRDTDERTTTVHALECDVILDPIVQPNQESSRSNSLKSDSFYRKVNFGKKSIFVSVSLNDCNYSRTPTSSLIKIGERFKKLRTTRERNFCPTCGRYNRLLKEGDSSESDKESDIMIPNSVDETIKSPKNLRKKKLNFNLGNSRRTDHKLPSSEYSSPNQNSQSLLNYDDEIDELDKPAQDAVNDSSKISDSSMSLTSRKKAFKIENVAEEVQIQEKPNTGISRKEVGLGIEKQWASDNDIDIIYESAMAGFRKLIDADEEKMLFKKCLYKNRGSIDFNSDSEKNLDSYFLESSPEVETPTLTENYSILALNNSGKTEHKSASSSHLASNMIKMLAKEKDKNKKF